MSARSWRSELRKLAVFEVAFYFAYRYGMTFPQEYPAPFWFPSSVLLCALLLTPRRVWWMYLVAALPIRLLLFVPEGTPTWFVPACALVDSLSALLAAWRLTPDREASSLFESVPGFARYFGAAVLLAPALSAAAGASTLTMLRGVDFWTTWQVWCLGNSLAHLSLTPTLYCLIHSPPDREPTAWRDHVEALLLSIGVAASSYIAFCPAQDATGHPVLLYLPVPFVLWAAARLGPMLTATTLSAVCVLAVVGTLSCGGGPFSLYEGPSRILEIQLFLLVVSAPFLALSVLFRERDIAHDRLRQLSGQLVSVQESERFRIGQELHDDLAQRLVTLSWGLAGLGRQAEGNERIASECARLRGQANDICNDIVRLSHELRPVVLERLGLAAALEVLCDQSSTAEGGHVHFERSGALASVPPNVELAIYRVAQEALRNALTHSGSDRIGMQLAESKSRLTLTIRDRGRGFEVGLTGATGMGLSGMEDRMKNVGGTLQIDSAPGFGTTVIASVPLPAEGTRG